MPARAFWYVSDFVCVFISVAKLISSLTQSHSIFSQLLNRAGGDTWGGDTWGGGGSPKEWSLCNLSLAAKIRLEENLHALYTQGYGSKPIVVMEQTNGMDAADCNKYWNGQNCDDGYKKHFFRQNFIFPGGSCLLLDHDGEVYYKRDDPSNHYFPCKDHWPRGFDFGNHHHRSAGWDSKSGKGSKASGWDDWGDSWAKSSKKSSNDWSNGGGGWWGTTPAPPAWEWESPSDWDAWGSGSKSGKSSGGDWGSSGGWWDTTPSPQGWNEPSWQGVGYEWGSSKASKKSSKWGGEWDEWWTPGSWVNDKYKWNWNDGPV